MKENIKERDNGWLILMLIGILGIRLLIKTYWCINLILSISYTFDNNYYNINYINNNNINNNINNIYI